MRAFQSYEPRVGPIRPPSRDCIIDEDELRRRLCDPSSTLEDIRAEGNLDSWEDCFDAKRPNIHHRKGVFILT